MWILSFIFNWIVSLFLAIGFWGDINTPTILPSDKIIIFSIWVSTVLILNPSTRSIERKILKKNINPTIRFILVLIGSLYIFNFSSELDKKENLEEFKARGDEIIISLENMYEKNQFQDVVRTGEKYTHTKDERVISLITAAKQKIEDEIELKRIRSAKQKTEDTIRDEAYDNNPSIIYSAEDLDAIPPETLDFLNK